MAGEEGRAGGERKLLGGGGEGGRRPRGTGQGSAYLRLRPALPWRPHSRHRSPGSSGPPARPPLPSPPPPGLPPPLAPASLLSRPRAGLGPWGLPPPLRPCAPQPGSPALRAGGELFGEGEQVPGGGLDGGDLQEEGRGRRREGGGEEDGGEPTSLVKRLVSYPHPIPVSTRTPAPRGSWRCSGLRS